MLPLARRAKGMVSPSKPSTYSRVASHQQSPKLKLVKGPRPLVNFRFYLDIEKHHVSSKIDRKIKELGGSVEFFLVKEVTHFVTDKTTNPAAPSHQLANSQQPPGTPTGSTPAAPKTPQTPQTPFSPSYHLHDPFDVCSPHAASTETRDTAPKPPRSRADAMLQRARRANHPTDRPCTPTSSNHHHHHHSSAAATVASPNVVHSRHTAYVAYRRIENSAAAASAHHSPVELAKSWGTPIWTPESTLKFLEKVAATLHSQKPSTPTSTAVPKSATAASASSRLSLAQQRPRAANTKRLKGDYIKIEATDRHYRPYYKELRAWPLINLQAEPGYCPFWQETNADTAAAVAAKQPILKPTVPIPPAPSIPPADSPAMTRKRRSLTNRTTTTTTTTATTATAHSNAKAAAAATHATAATVKQVQATAGTTAPPEANTAVAAATTAPTEAKCGYCEICHIEYDVLANHLQSAEHRRFVTNDDNFLTLDKMIGTGASMDTFLARNATATAATDAIKTTSDDAPEPVFGKRSAGKKSNDSKLGFRANGRSIGAAGANHSIVKDDATVYADATVTSPKVTSAKRRRRSNNNHAAAVMLLANGTPPPPLLERSSKAAAKAAVAAVAAVEGADDDDDDDEADVVMRSSLARKLEHVAAKPVVRFAHVPAATLRVAELKLAAAAAAAAAAVVDDADQSNRVRSRRESAKRINYSELREDDESPIKKPVPVSSVDSNSTAPAANKEAPKNGRKIQKMRLHGVRWRAPSDEDRRSAMSQPIYKVMDDSQSQLVTSTTAASTTSTSATSAQRNTADGTAAATDVALPPAAVAENGLKMRVCRVRNSELSALTNEADKFMFPRQNSSSEPPTDEDRQSTSEFGVVAADLSGELLSSEADPTPLAVLAAAQPPKSHAKGKECRRRRSRTESATSTNAPATGLPAPTAALDASNKRKRRKQLEAFLNDNSEYYKFDNPDSRLRFQEAPFQPIVGASSSSSSNNAAVEPAAATLTATTTATTTATNLLTPAKLAKRAAAASAAPPPSSPSIARLTRSAQQQQPPPVSPPRTPTRASRRPRRDSDDGKGAIGSTTPAPTSTPSPSRQATPTPADQTPAKHNAWLLASSSHQYQHETDVTAAMLRTEIVRSHRFSFERVPSAEPWYETFQRQDECREQIFEYWGSTAYRKLPYELGPLPPHAPNCCPLARLTPAKRIPRPKLPKNLPSTSRKQLAAAAVKRSGGSRNTVAQPSASSSPGRTRPSSVASNKNANQRMQLNSTGGASTASSTGSSCADHMHDIRVQKRLLKLHKNLEVNVLPNHHSTAAPPPSATSRTAALLATASSLEVRLHKRSVPLSQRLQQQQLLLRHGFHSAGEAEAIALAEQAASKGGKKDAFLLDINGRPRKSPREHASTLAILSCLVQQRRKREKELNGGISPEKLKRRRQRRSGAGDFCGHDGSNTATTTDTEFDDDEPDEDDIAGDEDQEMDDDRVAGHDVHRPDEVQAAAVIADGESTHVKLECDSDAEPMDIPADPPPTPPPDDTAAAFQPEYRQPAATNTSTYPPMPNLEYKSAHQLCREIDAMFAASDHDARLAGYLADMDNDCGSRLPVSETSSGSGSLAERSADLVLIGTPVDFVDIVQSVPAGPLRYRHQRGGAIRKKGVRKPLVAALGSFSFGTTNVGIASGTVTTGAANRKRRNNRTGWPTLPRRRPTMPVASSSTLATAVAAANEELAAEPVPALKVESVAQFDADEKPDADEKLADAASVSADAADDDMLLAAEDETTCSTALSAPQTDRDEDVGEEDNETAGTEEEEEEEQEEDDKASQELEPEEGDDEHDEEDEQESQDIELDDEKEEDEAVEDDEEELVADADDTADGSAVTMEPDDEETATAPASPATAADDTDEADTEKVDLDLDAEEPQPDEVDDNGDEDDETVAETAAAIRRAQSLCAAFAASGSEKAENSDIFTVSSDSVDTADLANNIALPSQATVAAAASAETTPRTMPLKSAVDDEPSAAVSERELTPLAEIPLTDNVPVHQHQPCHSSHNNSSEQAAAAITPSLGPDRSSAARRKAMLSARNTKPKRRRRRGGTVGRAKQANTASASSSTSSSVLSSPSSSASSSSLDADAAAAAAASADAATTTTNGELPTGTTSTTTVRAQLLMAATTASAAAALEHHRMLLQPVVRVKKINMMPEGSAASRRRSVRSEERLAAVAAAAAVATATTTATEDFEHHQHNCSSNGDMSVPTSTASLSLLSQLQSPTSSAAAAVAAPAAAAAAAAAAVNKAQFSPPKLRKPRGRWYRER